MTAAAGAGAEPSPSNPPAGAVAYIVSRFPHLPETFILREFSELERQGERVELFPLVHHHEAVAHPEAQAWERRAHYAPFLSRAVLAANLKALARAPARYLSLYARALWHTRQTPNFFVAALGLYFKLIYFSAEMQRLGVRHIHAHFATHPALAAWVISQWTGLPYSFTIHAHDLYVHTTMLCEKVRRARFVVTISEFNRQRVGELCGEKALAKLNLIHYGIDPDLYAPNGSRPPAYQRSSFRVVSVASLEPYKGLNYLIEACALARPAIPGLECLIAGRGEQQSALQAEIEARGLQDCVKLLGGQTQAQVADLLRRADVFVLPSIVLPSGKMEGMPNAIIEAMAAQLPVVATRISGIPELVAEGETGVLVPPGDSRALAQALCELYNEPERRAQMGLRGRARALNSFVLRANVERLHRLLLQRA